MVSKLNDSICRTVSANAPYNGHIDINVKLCQLSEILLFMTKIDNEYHHIQS